VLVIGGGDGGVIRELDRHPCVKEIVLCEIDEVRGVQVFKFDQVLLQDVS